MTTYELPVIFEDDSLWVVNKPPGLASIPERLDHSAPCVWKLGEQLTGQRLWVVHRLDKETSGVMLLAKTADAHRKLSQAFEKRETRKLYWAWVHGELQGQGNCVEPLREFGSGRVAVDARGKPSQTDWKALKTQDGFTLGELRPRTGRRHQIRAHLFYLGHPIVGDPLYGPAQLRHGWKRLYLHAVELEIPGLELTSPGGPWRVYPDEILFTPHL